MQNERLNAVIKTARLTMSDGPLMAWLDLDYGNCGCQGFGGYVLWLDKTYTKHKVSGVGGHFIGRTMQVAGVTDWASLPGRSIRVDLVDGLIRRIGHIINDDWFEPRADFEDVD